MPEHLARQPLSNLQEPTQPMMRLFGLHAGNARLANGDRYTGEWLAGVPSGQGRCLFGNGDRYDGEWLAGKRSGQGRCSYANGDKYQGGDCIFASLPSMMTVLCRDLAYAATCVSV